MTRIKLKDRIGTTVNGFFVKDVKREDGKSYVYVLCPICKKYKWIVLENVKKMKSCGCQTQCDITGQFFGELKAVRPTEERRYGNVVWECECKCGNTAKVPINLLKYGMVSSCGCFQKKMQHEKGKRIANIVKEQYCVGGTNVNSILMQTPKSNTSGIKGVSYIKKNKKYRAYITFKYKQYNLGSFAKLEDAEQARKKAEEQIFGDFLKWYAETYPERWERLNKRRKYAKKENDDRMTE